MQAMSLRNAAVEKRALSRFLLGASLALVGVGLVEGLVLAGLRPLGPVVWPGLGMLAGAALGGMAGLAGGSVVLFAYYLVNFAYQQRFPEFYAHPYNTVSLVAGLAVLAVAIIAARPRVMRAASAEAELATRRLFEDALRESEERLRVIADNLPALVSYIDTEERYRFNNRAYEDWLGIPRPTIDGRTVREVWGEARYALMKPNIERALLGERVSHDYAFTERGVERHILASYVPDLDGAGRVKGFFVLGSDVTQLAAARNELRAAHTRLESALDGSSVALWDTDLRTGRVFLSDAWAEIIGAPAGDTVASLDELIALIHPDDVEAAKRASLEVMKGMRGTYSVEHRVRSRTGEWRWILSRGRVTERDPATGRALRMVGTNLDITDRRRVEEAVQSVAQSDALTGLPNRLLFTDRLRLAMARSRRSGMELAVLYLDIDGFKRINDSLGHAAGDTLLRDFAMRLRASVRATDTVARFGGDEFVVLLEDVKVRDHAARIAEKIIEEARRPLRIEGQELTVTASIGLAFSSGGADEESLIKRADAALYEAKAAGRNGYRVAA